MVMTNSGHTACTPSIFRIESMRAGSKEANGEPIRKKRMSTCLGATTIRFMGRVDKMPPTPVFRTPTTKLKRTSVAPEAMATDSSGDIVDARRNEKLPNESDARFRNIIEADPQRA
jgi:hypothetical protein